MNKIQLGNRVKDIVTGFEGIVTGDVRYMNGCEKWAVDGKFVNNQVECLWIDKQQAEKIDDGIADQLETKIDNSYKAPDVEYIIIDTINKLKACLDEARFESAGLSGGPMRTPTRA